MMLRANRKSRVKTRHFITKSLPRHLLFPSPVQCTAQESRTNEGSLLRAWLRCAPGRGATFSPRALIVRGALQEKRRIGSHGSVSVANGKSAFAASFQERTRI